MGLTATAGVVARLSGGGSAGQTGVMRAICIVLAVTPALALLQARDPGAARRVALGGSAVVIAAGGYWFLQRLFFAT